MSPAEYPIELADPDGRTRYTITNAYPLRYENQQHLYLSVDICGQVQYQQYGIVKGAEQLQQAGLAHFHGPLSVHLLERPPAQLPLAFILGEKSQPLHAMVTTNLPDHGSWVAVQAERKSGEAAFPLGVVPVADIEFLSTVSGGSPVRRRVALDKTC